MVNQLNLEALWHLSYGLYIVASHADGKYNGQIANAVCQVTAQPPQVMVAINKDNYTHQFIDKSGVFSVSVLDASTSMSLILHMGFQSGKDAEKFSALTYSIGVTGAPIVKDYAISAFEARVIAKHDVGSHTLFVGEVVAAEILTQGSPLTYADYYRIKKGTTPKNAPTYRGVQHAQTAELKPALGKKYECGVCGFVYDPEVGDPERGFPPGTPFETLPDTWTCPVCGADKDQFSRA